MKAKIIVNKNFIIGETDKRIYGSFIEHLGRAVYNGIYEPTHETANEQGFRTDVLEMIKDINVPIVRYPGGNFVSGYCWEDGIGDRSKRPRKLDLAWSSIETNEIGIDEFQEWAKQANSEIMMTVNLGTRGPQDAQNLLEYCNSSTNTHYANLRKENGFEAPFNIKTWCLGNEMDADWQICHKTAEEYGRIATETAKIMKLADPNIELVLCGSSSYDMETFGEWELTVLDHAYNDVDYISMHQYYENHNNNTADFLGKSVHMDAFIKSVVAMCDSIKAKKHSNKTINISFDEWNVWFYSNLQDSNVTPWQVAPHLLEDIYTFEAALVVGCMLITLQNNCDRVKIACLAQLVNVIAPIMTENNGKAWAQTTYYPYMFASRFGRGITLRPVVKCDSYKTTDNFIVPYIEASVIHNPQNHELTVFAVNRSLDEDMELELMLEGFDSASLFEHIELFSENLKATNTVKNTNAVVPTIRQTNNASSGPQEVILKKHSWNMLRFTY